MKRLRLYVFKNKYRIALILIPCLLLAGSTLYLSHNTFRYSETDPAYNRAYWEQIIRTKSGEEAYALFLKKNREAPSDRQHLAAHAMGESLYAVLDVAGFAYCTKEFGFGCYHGFAGRAIADKGLMVVDSLNAACNAGGRSFVSCQHGIGHAILEYVGHERVEEAIAICLPIQKDSPLFSGCVSGIFMEYYFPLTEGSRFPNKRSYDPAHPYEPCDRIDAPYRNVCYFSLGQWFAELGKKESTCADLSEPEAEICALGIRNVEAVNGAKSLEILQHFCALVPLSERTGCPAPLETAR